ncbi:Tweety [Phytophthora cactorum]|nr:Tweety [Phytophthora cactorum]
MLRPDQSVLVETTHTLRDGHDCGATDAVHAAQVERVFAAVRPKSYTGVYKKRFEADCNDLTERVVHDLSNAMRTNLNYDVNRPKQRTASIRNTSSSNSSLAPALSPVSASAERPTSAPLVQEKLQGDPNDPHTLLKAVFHYYCRFGRTGPKGLGEKTLGTLWFSSAYLLEKTSNSVDIFRQLELCQTLSGLSRPAQRFLRQDGRGSHLRKGQEEGRAPHQLRAISRRVGHDRYPEIRRHGTLQIVRTAEQLFVRRTSMDSTSVELLAVGLLTFLAISALGGLLGEAQVDYSAGVVLDTMTNTSDLFHEARELTTQSLQTSNGLRVNADNLITSFNDSELPAEAFKMSVEALRLVHARRPTAPFLRITGQFPVYCIGRMGHGLATARLDSGDPERCTHFTHADRRLPVVDDHDGGLCAAPLNNTLELIGTTPVANYYVECPANASLPFADAMASVQQTAAEVTALQQELERSASRQGPTGQRMKREFLDPIGKQLDSVDNLMTEFAASQTCKNVSRAFEYAATTYCEYGMLGFFSMWVHQILLCLILFVCVVVSVLVYERVHIREIRQDVRYQLLSSYEDDDMEHVYLSSD